MRYSRQARFHKLGQDGQFKLAKASVLVIGCGALGSVSSELLTRAGIGKIRIIDRDIVEIHNLHRQVLFTEQDVHDAKPKAEAAVEHLRKINSEISIEAVVSDFNFTNAERFTDGIDIIVLFA